MQPMRPRARITTLAALAAMLAGCQAAPSSPDPTGRADPEMLSVLAAYRASGAKPVAGLTPEEARAQPTLQDAAASVVLQTRKAVKQPVGKVSDTTMPGPAGPMAARVYDPRTDAGPAPVILYFHGGGWVTGTLATYDSSCRALAEGTGAIVVSAQYRLAPENRFPAAHDDADAAYAWLAAEAPSLGGDPARIALAGEGAGASLALDAALHARDSHARAPVHLLLINPFAGTDTTLASYEETKDAVPLNRAAMQWYFRTYANSPADLADPRLNPATAGDLHGLPPTTMILAVIDPLASEGRLLTQRLQAAGVTVQQRVFPGVTHGFFGMGQVVGQARRAEDLAVLQLASAFGGQPRTPLPAAPAPPPPLP